MDIIFVLIVIMTLAFFLLRNIITWYFKINKIVENLDAQKEIMIKILNKL